MPELLDRVDVGAIAVPDVDQESPLRQAIEAKAAQQEIPIYYITQTSQVALGRAQLTLYEPRGEAGSSNELCLSVLCALDDWQALLTGDMPEDGESRLAAQKNLPDGELLVAGHHGSKYSTGETLLTVFQPETAVISVGHNSYGHPTPETLARLAEAGAHVYRTDRHGTVTVYAQNREEA